MKWSSDRPHSGWWFQRWKSEPDRWFIVEVFDGIVQAVGLLPGDIERAQLNGAEWAGPITLPESVKLPDL